ncbi:MAG: Rieske 2Fe-2S domain-containing protein [Hyphomicrobiales bacterium]|nr:Rieske 2Fe-2S domain-containing protein [Hyphomicrobiales bacterium]
MSTRHDVCASKEVTIGTLKPVKVGRMTVVLARLPCGSLRAVSGRCPHHGARLEFGCITGLTEAIGRDAMKMEREGEILRCPWHGFEFDLVSGEPAVAPPSARSMRLRFFDVAEDNERVLVTI